MDALTYALSKGHTNKEINLLMYRLNQLEPREIFGASWAKVDSPILARTDSAVGMTAAVGVDSQIVTNNFDTAPIFRDITEVADSLGNIFVRIPKFYIRKTDGVSLKTWQISKYPHVGFYLPRCFWDFANNRELPWIDVGKYKATLSAGNKLESKPGSAPVISRHIVAFRTLARNNNADGLVGYQQLDIHVYDMLQTLFYVEFATLHSQSIMQGFTTGQYSATHVATMTEVAANRVVLANAHADQYRVGQTISMGTSLGGNQIFYGRDLTAIEVVDASTKALVFDGDPINITAGNIVYNTGWRNGFSSSVAASSGSPTSNTDGKWPCVYRGIESLYGDTWQFVDGVNINDNQAWTANNAAEYASNVFAHPYQQLSYVNHNAEGYPIAMGYDAERPFAALPTAVGGSSSTRYADYYYQMAGQRIALVGGNWYFGAFAGLSSWNLYNSSSIADLIIGARLLKKPL